jgi:glycosyltransferase involved in cell wall biosynthesis
MSKMPKLRIFFISPWSRRHYQEKQKGFEGSVEFRLVKGFIDKGHEVHLLMPKERNAPKDFSYSGIFIHEFRMPFTRFGKNRISRLAWRLIYDFSFVFFSTRSAMKVAKVYSKPHVIYGFGAHGCVTAYIASRLWRIPNITRLFGTFLYPSLSNKFRLLFSHLEEVLAFKLPCKYLIILDDGTRGDEVARKLKVPSERVKFWMDGASFLYDTNIDPKKVREELEIPKQAHVIVSVGRLAPWKKVDRLIRAVPAVVSNVSDVKVLIIGDGRERENLERLSDASGVKKFVSFLGAIHHEDIKKYLHAADLFISLQDYSNVSNVLLEAMACGVCTIALNSGATNHVIKNEKNGILINYDELQNLPSIISRLLSDDSLRRKLGNNARQYALENFKTWSERIAMETELIETLCGIKS